MNMPRLYLMLTIVTMLILTICPVHAQIGELIWQEDFNDLDSWIIETGNGSWGWGNGELQYYKAEKRVRRPLLGDEPGKQCPEDHCPSGKRSRHCGSMGKPFAIHLRKIEHQVHDLHQVWRDRSPGEGAQYQPRWMAGSVDAGHGKLCLASQGEIDIMEMGFNQAFQNLHDDHNGGNGNNNSTVNQMVGANAIFYSDAAVTPQNPSGAASLAWDPDDEFCRPYYNYDPGLTDRFLIYRVYWDEDRLRFTVTDNGNEYDLFAEPFSIDEESAEFREPFHLVANLAIGGALTDAYNLGDPGSGQPVTLPFPAHMYIDYIKVMKWNNQGTVQIGPPPFEEISFGIYTDETPVNNGLEPDLDAHIYVWENTLSPGSIPPYEGENGISWVTNGLGWFGAGIMSIQPVNLFNFADGHLKFMIKIPAHITFKIGIIDAWGNQNYVSFPAGQTTHGLIRNGDWGQAAIPVSILRGPYIDLRMLSYPFVILEESGAQCEFGLDDIYWDGGSTDIIHDTIPPVGFELKANYPNPFNPNTTISFNLKEASEISLEIYNVYGQRIKVLSSGSYRAGENSVSWDGTDSGNRPVASGIYFYQLRTPKGLDTRKCVLLK
ncbi:MAG: T9SS type A sorting domain-containing protein [Candidatus Cloacimonetes bacterium]|nr:T9SS type A sorting domain-containing protein [Candidatus Cloacimonadota bacterium]